MMVTPIENVLQDFYQQPTTGEPMRATPPTPMIRPLTFLEETAITIKYLLMAILGILTLLLLALIRR
jgi:hypothetical protein